MEKKVSVIFGPIIRRRSMVRDSFYGVFQIILKIFNFTPSTMGSHGGFFFFFFNQGELSDVYIYIYFLAL